MVAPGQRLSQIFGTYEMRDRIKPETSNADVITVIRAEAESAIANSFNVLRNRIDRFGVTQPNIQKIGNSGRILVELPGVKEPDRVRKLLQGTASLEFWETYENQEVYQYLVEANKIVKEVVATDTIAVTPLLTAAATDSLKSVADTSKAAAALLKEIKSSDTLNVNQSQVAKENPLFFLLNPNVSQGTANPWPMCWQGSLQRHIKNRSMVENASGSSRSSC